MAKSFRLAGLLRFRQAQEDQAAAALSRANGAHREQQRQLGRVHGILAAAPSDVGSATALRASAAARSASRSTLLELQALTATAAELAATAQQELLTAKKAAASLEKLADRHELNSRQLLLRDEQLFLDELAGSRATASGAEDTPGATGAAAPEATQTGPEKK